MSSTSTTRRPEGREWGHFPAGIRAEGFGHCYDCAAAAQIWRKYLLQTSGEQDEEELRTGIAQMLETQGRHLGQPLLPPHGVRSRADGRPDPDEEGGGLLAVPRREHEQRRRRHEKSRRVAAAGGGGEPPGKLNLRAEA